MPSPSASSFPEASAETEAWACRLAERLPLADMRRLSRAAAGGVPAVHSMRATAANVAVHTACNSLIVRLGSEEPAYLAGLLAGTARAVERARQHQSVKVVWTGPESGMHGARLTAAAVIELIDSARADILLISFATQTEPTIRDVLEAAVARGVAMTLLAERTGDNPSYTSARTPFPSLRALRLHWPASSRPAHVALHANLIVIDDEVALVGSANLTSRAMEDDLECGILPRGGPQPRAIRDHITSLYAAGALRRF